MAYLVLSARRVFGTNFGSSTVTYFPHSRYAVRDCATCSDDDSVGHKQAVTLGRLLWDKYLIFQNVTKQPHRCNRSPLASDRVPTRGTNKFLDNSLRAVKKPPICDACAEDEAGRFALKAILPMSSSISKFHCAAESPTNPSHGGKIPHGNHLRAS